MLCGGGVRIIDEIANIDDLKQVRPHGFSVFPLKL